MRKGFKLYAIVWAIFLAVFNVACFASPSEVAGMTKFGGAFWAGYIGITAAFIGQLFCAYTAFKETDIKRFFLNVPLICISYTTLVLTVVFGTLCMVIPDLPNWVGIVVSFAILAFGAISVIKAKAAAEIVSDVEDKVKANTFFIKSLTVDAEGLMSRADGGEMKAELRKVYEAVRYSDPMSNEALASVEDQIRAVFSKLTDAVAENNTQAVKQLSSELVILVNDRNKRCRLK